MRVVRFVPALVLLALASCDKTRTQECDRFLSTMKPIENGTPTVETVDATLTAIKGFQIQDQPLREYASSTKATLTTLANTLRMQADPNPPDGTDELVKTKLAEARGEYDDVSRYCAE